MPKKRPPLAVRKLTKHELENKVQDILDERDHLDAQNMKLKEEIYLLKRKVEFLEYYRRWVQELSSLGLRHAKNLAGHRMSLAERGIDVEKEGL
jgi:predicted RNase H-like nuclease (RuvC/YqgF family)